jgi:hypothetical protein
VRRSFKAYERFWKRLLRVSFWKVLGMHNVDAREDNTCNFSVTPRVA